MRVFLTGGTGFIGGEVARRLRARGDDVRALVRDPDRAAGLRDLGCELVRGDLSDEEALVQACRGMTHVVHAAAVYAVGVPASRRDELVDANVRGTERVLSAALAAGITKAVYGRQAPGLPFPDLGVTPVHRDDVAAGILLALDEGVPGESYVLAGQPVRMRELIGELGSLSGRKAPRTVPTVLLRALAPAGRVVGPLLGFPPNLRELIASSDGVTFWACGDKARAQLGWTSRPLREGLQELVDARAVRGRGRGRRRARRAGPAWPDARARPRPRRRRPTPAWR